MREACQRPNQCREAKGPRMKKNGPGPGHGGMREGPGPRNTTCAGSG